MNCAVGSLTHQLMRAISVPLDLSTIAQPDKAGRGGAPALLLSAALAGGRSQPCLLRSPPPPCCCRVANMPVLLRLLEAAEELSSCCWKTAPSGMRDIATGMGVWAHREEVGFVEKGRSKE